MANVLKHTEYLLLNKDTGILRFTCDRNDFDEPEFFIQEWLSSLRPIGFGVDAPGSEGNGNLSAFWSGGRPSSTAATSRRFWSGSAVTIWRDSSV